MHQLRFALAVLAATPMAQSVDSPPGVPFEDLRRHVPLVEEGLHLNLADLDGDRAPELVVAGLNDVRVLRNDGHGKLDELEVAGPFRGPTYTPGVRTAAGDLDGDGDLDLFVGSRPAFNDGSGRLRLVSTPAPILSHVRDLLLADVDGDEDLDAVFGDDGDTWLLLNEGGESFSDGSSRLPEDRVRTLAAADVDRDGDVDLVRNSVLLRNDGHGSFHEDVLAVPGTWERLVFADADADGYPDLFVVSYFGLFYLRNVEGLRFEEAEVLPAPHGIEFSVADFDGDGDVDVLSVDPPFLLANDGSGAFVDASGGLPRELSGPLRQELAADVDRDGDLDVLSLRRSNGPTPLRLWLGDGEGRFLEAQRHVPPERFLPLALVDVDGDGDLDVAGKAEGGPAAVRRNDGTGVLGPAPELFAAIPVLPFDPRDVAGGDVDGDGDQDLLWAGAELHVNQGPAGFADETAMRLPSGVRSARALALADLDADGDLDAFLANSGTALGSYFPNTFLRNDGDGFFSSDQSALPPRTETTGELAVGDVDGDGLLDVLLANAGQNVLLLADGSGGFEDATERLPVDPASKVTYDAALADLDGDGDLDAYLADAGITLAPSYEGGHYPRTNRVLRNEGGWLVHDPVLHETHDVGYEVELGDFDGDRDVDVLIGTALWRAGCCRVMGGETVLYRNEGDGTLSPGETLQGYLDVELVAGDMDGDADLDVVTPERVLTNVERSLSWESLPRAGRPLELALRGSPGAPFVLLSSERPAAIPTDRGILRIDLGANGLLVPGVFGPAGRFRFDFPVPDVLGGVTLYWQALVGGDTAGFTNLEPTTFLTY